MSASPPAPMQSTKRPLEEPSSPSAPSDQPDAKRPALDKISKEEAEEEKPADTPALAPSGTIANGEEKTQSANGVKTEVKDAQGDTLVTDAPTAGDVPQSIESTVPDKNPLSSGPALQHDESGWIHVRAVITSAEAATVIGKGGENVSVIRKMSGAKCTVSDYQKGAVERILTVSGQVDHTAKVSSRFLLISCRKLTRCRPLD